MGAWNAFCGSVFDDESFGSSSVGLINVTKVVVNSTFQQIALDKFLESGLLQRPMNSQDASKGSFRWSIPIVTLIIFIDIVGFSIIFPIFPAMLEYYLNESSVHASYLREALQALQNLMSVQPERAQFLSTVLFGGILGALYAFLQFIFAPIWGRLSDRYGRRTILNLTIPGMLLGYGVWAFSDSFLMLIVSRIICGGMSGNLSVCAASIADVTTRETRTRGMAMISIGFALGFIMGPGIGGVTAHINLLNYFPSLAHLGIHDFSVPALVAAGFSILNLIVVRCVFKETLSVDRRQIKPLIGGYFTIRDKGEAWTPSLRCIQRVISVSFLFNFIFGSMEFMIPFLALDRFMFTPRQNGYVFVYLGLVMVICQGMLVRRFGHKIGEKRVAIIGFVSGMIAFSTMALSQLLPTFASGITFLAFAAACCYPSLTALVSMYAHENEQGRYMGSSRSAQALARVFGPLFGGMMYFCFGSVAAYMTGAMLLMVPIALIVAIPRPEEVDVPVRV